MHDTNPLSTLPPEIVQSDVFQAAVTHRSASKNNNERLEFLGDAVLGLIIGHALFHRFSNANEGDLSRLRAYLVRKEMLASIALAHKVNEWLQLGSGEKKSGGFRRESILADSLEAIIGAIYLLRGMEFAESFVLDLYSERLNELPALDSLKDAKTRLQEYLQAKRMELPKYTILQEHDEGDKKTFDVECRIEELNISAVGRGKSKRKAEQTAAMEILSRLDLAG